MVAFIRLSQVLQREESRNYECSQRKKKDKRIMNIVETKIWASQDDYKHFLHLHD